MAFPQAVVRIVHAVNGDGLIGGHGEVLVLKKIPAALSSRGEVEPFRFVPVTKGREIRPVTEPKGKHKEQASGIFCMALG
jgi:hypothetical protein